MPDAYNAIVAATARGGDIFARFTVKSNSLYRLLCSPCSCETVHVNLLVVCIKSWEGGKGEEAGAPVASTEAAGVSRLCVKSYADKFPSLEAVNRTSGRLTLQAHHSMYSDVGSNLRRLWANEDTRQACA